MSVSRKSSDSPEVLALFNDGLELVDLLGHQLRRYFGPYVQTEDLIAHGREALLAAARNYDADKGVPFRRWANLRVRGAMIDSVRQQGNLPRRVYRQLRALLAGDEMYEALAEEQALPTLTVAEAADEELSDQLGTAAMAMAMAFLSMKSGDAIHHAADPNDGPEDTVIRAELIETVRNAILERPEAERRLLERYYFDELSFEEAANELGLSKSWASRLHARAMEGIAKAMKRGRIIE
jgi:RNA polymerase sigma factor for flagellar operon FliA